jgi:hypothetical protein
LILLWSVSSYLVGSEYIWWLARLDFAESLSPEEINRFRRNLSIITAPINFTLGHEEKSKKSSKEEKTLAELLELVLLNRFRGSQIIIEREYSPDTVRPVAIAAVAKALSDYEDKVLKISRAKEEINSLRVKFRQLIAEHNLIAQSLMEFFMIFPKERLTNTPTLYKNGVLAGLPQIPEIPDDLRNLKELLNVVSNLKGRSFDTLAEVEEKILSLHLIYRETGDGIARHSQTLESLNKEIAASEQAKKDLAKSIIDLSHTRFMEMQSTFKSPLQEYLPQLPLLMEEAARKTSFYKYFTITPFFH